ncbi:hypothetical protein B0H14DRAFT_2439367, partial [Mycena olivaceomarginata]
STSSARRRAACCTGDCVRRAAAPCRLSPPSSTAHLAVHRTLAAPPHNPSDRPLHPIAPSTSDESTALCLPARVPWDASDSGGFGSVVNAN